MCLSNWLGLLIVLGSDCSGDTVTQKAHTVKNNLLHPLLLCSNPFIQFLPILLYFLGRLF